MTKAKQTHDNHIEYKYFMYRLRGELKTAKVGTLKMAKIRRVFCIGKGGAPWVD